MWIWALIAVAVFVASRAFVYFGFGVYVTDIWLYHAAGSAAAQGLSAYCDYWFPYPPLSLPLINLPALVSTEENTYRAVFRAEMFIFDVLCFLGLWIFLKERTRATETRRGIALCLYGVLGPFLGHLLYDRLDIVMAGIFIWAIFFFTSRRPWGRPACYILLLAGALLKLLPLFLLPVFIVLEIFSGEKSWPDIRRGLRPAAWVVVPFAAVIYAYNSTICDKLVPILAEQGARGIQIESNWALPLIVWRLLGNIDIRTDYIFGAFHILDTGVPAIYLALSKNVGFVGLAAFYTFVYFRFRKNLIDSNRLDPVTVLHLFFSSLMVIIIGQRVLSPQYLIWLIPLACIQFAVAKRPGIAVTGILSVYGLTFLIFDIGFFPILDFHPYYSLALLVRNVLLILWTADLAKRILKSLRLERAATVTGA